MTIRIERDGPVTTVVIARPERRNAVDPATAEALRRAFEDFDADEAARAAVLVGEGESFCAGADLKALAEGEVHRLEKEGPGPMGPTRLSLSKPVIAAIAGHAVAGGLELALWCDLRVVERGATFGVFCRRFGVPLIDGGTVRLPRLIGMSRALDLILTGRPVDAEEALAIGLANRLCEKGQARSAAEALARQLAELPQVCLRNDRRSCYEQAGLSHEAAMRREFELGLATLNSGEAFEGARRFRDGDGRHGQPRGDAERTS